MARLIVLLPIFLLAVAVYARPEEPAAEPAPEPTGTDAPAAPAAEDAPAEAAETAELSADEATEAKTDAADATEPDATAAPEPAPEPENSGNGVFASVVTTFGLAALVRAC